jgi:hypothetical protein
MIYGITNSAAPSLVRLDSADPGTPMFVGPVGGILANHHLSSIDFRPSNGRLYGLSVDQSDAALAQLYTIDLATATATAIGAGLTLPGNAHSTLSIDFDPVADVLRVVSILGTNYRVRADAGGLIARDMDLSGNVLLGGIAYSNNLAGASRTTLYACDDRNVVGNLGTIGGPDGVPSPDGGDFHAIGGAGLSLDGPFSFDISGATGVGYLSGSDSNLLVNGLYTVDLSTGSLSLIGETYADLRALTVVPAAVPEPASLAMAGLGILGVAGLAIRRWLA